MVGKSPVTVDEEQRQELLALSHSRDRGGPGACDLAHSVGLDQRPDCRSFRGARGYGAVWRSTVMTGGVEALKKSVAPGPAPVKAECALAVAEEVLSGPVADRPNGTP